MPSTEHLPAVTPNAGRFAPRIRRVSGPAPVTADVRQRKYYETLFCSLDDLRTCHAWWVQSLESHF